MDDWCLGVLTDVSKSHPEVLLERTFIPRDLYFPTLMLPCQEEAIPLECLRDYIQLVTFSGTAKKNFLT